MSMLDFLISKEQARQFAYDCFDVIIRDIKLAQDTETENDEEEQIKTA